MTPPPNLAWVAVLEPLHTSLQIKSKFRPTASRKKVWDVPSKTILMTRVAPMTNETMLLNTNIANHIFGIPIIFAVEETVQTLREMCISLIIQNWHSSAILSLNRIHKVIIKEALISSLPPAALGKSVLLPRIREILEGLFFCIYLLFCFLNP